MAANSLSPSDDGRVSICDHCGCGGLLDEHARCEACVRDLERRAIGLQNLDDAVTEALERGLTAEQLREALELSLSNQAGAVADGSIARQPAATHDALWEVEPDSLFLAHDTPTKGPLRHLRSFSDLTLQELAEKVGTDPSTVGLWETGAPIPQPTLDRLAELFGVKPTYLGGEN